jgi:hypothetical protein
VLALRAVGHAVVEHNVGLLVDIDAERSDGEGFLVSTAADLGSGAMARLGDASGDAFILRKLV